MYSRTPLPQERKVVTSIPGPKSQEILKRRAESTSAALSMAMPIVVDRAYGAILHDVDGNQIIDLGSGIGVTGVGNSAERVAKRVMEQVQDITHTLSLIHI